MKTLLLLLLSQTIYCQIGIYNKDSLIVIYDHLINSIDPKTEFLCLGEQWHGDGTTFSIKSDLIQALCKKNNAVFFSESSAFDCQKGKEVGVFNDTLNMGISNTWSRTEEFLPVMKALEKKEIEYEGIDVQIYDLYSKRYLVDFFKKNILNKDFLTEQQKQYLFSSTDSLIKNRYKYQFTNQSFIEWENLFKIIELNQKSFSEKDFYIIYNIKNFGYLTNMYGNKKNNFIKANRYRDSLMALNCIYLKEHFYKNRLIVLSAASFHIIKNHIVDYPSSDKNIKTLGDFLSEKYSTKLSIVIFTSSNGVHAPYNDTRSTKVPKPVKNSFEYAMLNNNYKYYYTNLKNNKTPFIYIMPDGYEYIKMLNPSIHFDSIFYVREMQRTTSIFSK